VRYVEIRESSRGALIEEKLIEQAIRKSVIGFGGGEGVNALSPSVSGMKFKSMGNAFCHVCLKCVIKRTGLPQSRIDTAEIGVDRVARGGGREHIPCRRQRGKNHVNVVHAIGKVNSAGTDIAKSEGKRRRQFSGQTQIPLHDVIALGIEFDVGGKAGIRLITELSKSTGGKHARLESIGEDRLHEWHSTLK